MLLNQYLFLGRWILLDCPSSNNILKCHLTPTAKSGIAGQLGKAHVSAGTLDAIDLLGQVIMD